MLSKWRPCPYCHGAGCSICAGVAIADAQKMRMRRESQEFIQANVPKHVGDEYVINLVAAAIEHGRRLQSGETLDALAEEAEQERRSRWDMLEWENPQEGKECEGTDREAGEDTPVCGPVY